MLGIPLGLLIRALRRAGQPRAARPADLATLYAGVDGEGVREALAREAGLEAALVAARPEIERYLPGANPTLRGVRALPLGYWVLGLRLETDLSARDFAAAWGAFERDWWGPARQHAPGLPDRPEVVYRTPPHDQRDAVDRFFRRAAGVDAFLDQHPFATGALAAAIGPLRARYASGYELRVREGRLLLAHMQPGGMLMPGNPEAAALRAAWGAVAAMVPDLLDPEPVLERYVI